MAALNLGRHFLGIEINGEYVELARERVQEAEHALPSVNGAGLKNEVMQRVDR